MPDIELLRKILLIVDGSNLIIERLLRILGDVKSVGKIYTSKDFSEAVNILKQQHTDIVLIDIQLPAKSGFELLKFISSEYPETRIIVLSNLVSAYHQKLCKELGATYFVDKSKDFDMIPEIIERM